MVWLPLWDCVSILSKCCLTRPEWLLPTIPKGFTPTPTLCPLPLVPATGDFTYPTWFKQPLTITLYYMEEPSTPWSGEFHSFLMANIPLCIYIPLLYPFICSWALRLLPSTFVICRLFDDSHFDRCEMISLWFWFAFLWWLAIIKEQNLTMFGNRVFEEVIKVKWGLGGGSANPK